MRRSAKRASSALGRPRLSAHQSVPPGAEDFLSDKARQKRLRDRSPETLAHHEGLSAWRSLARIREVARRFPTLGTHVAELELPPGTKLLPFREDPEHLTVVEEPDVLLRFVVRVMPVD